jgi:hypothetical protein
MDQEVDDKMPTRELLEENLELARENNKMLLAMRRSMRIAHVMSFLYWTFIIGTAVGAYYFIQPYFDQLVGIYGGAKDGIDTVGEVFKNLNP